VGATLVSHVGETDQSGEDEGGGRWNPPKTAVHRRKGTEGVR
jgi:hypothetical protein